MLEVKLNTPAVPWMLAVVMDVVCVVAGALADASSDPRRNGSMDAGEWLGRHQKTTCQMMVCPPYKHTYAPLLEQTWRTSSLPVGFFGQSNSTHRVPRYAGRSPRPQGKDGR